MWMLQAFVVTADFTRDVANNYNKCVTCDRAFSDAAERQRFMTKQACCFTLDLWLDWVSNSCAYGMSLIP